MSYVGLANPPLFKVNEKCTKYLKHKTVRLLLKGKYSFNSSWFDQVVTKQNKKKKEKLSSEKLSIFNTQNTTKGENILLMSF